MHICIKGVRKQWKKSFFFHLCSFVVTFSLHASCLLGKWISTVRPVSRKAGNLSSPKANFVVKTCWIVAQFVAHKAVNFASLNVNFIVRFSKLLKLWSWMQTRQTKNRFSGPKSYRDFGETGPWAELFIAGLKLTRVSAKFEFRHESLNGKFS